MASCTICMISASLAWFPSSPYSSCPCHCKYQYGTLCLLWSFMVGTVHEEHQIVSRSLPTQSHDLPPPAPLPCSSASLLLCDVTGSSEQQEEGPSFMFLALMLRVPQSVSLYNTSREQSMQFLAQGLYVRLWCLLLYYPLL